MAESPSLAYFIWWGFWTLLAIAGIWASPYYLRKIYLELKEGDSDG